MAETPPAHEEGQELATEAEDRLGNAVQQVIAASGLSVQELGRIAGVAWTSVSRWKSGASTPRLTNAEALAGGIRERALEMLAAAAYLEAVVALEEKR